MTAKNSFGTSTAVQPGPGICYSKCLNFFEKKLAKDLDRLFILLASCAPLQIGLIDKGENLKCTKGFWENDGDFFIQNSSVPIQLGNYFKTLLIFPGIIGNGEIHGNINLTQPNVVVTGISTRKTHLPLNLITNFCLNRRFNDQKFSFSYFRRQCNDKSSGKHLCS